MQTRKKTKLAESPAGFQNLLENLHETKEGRTSDCGHPESSTLIDASRKDVGKLLERVGDRQELTRKRKENTSGSKKRKSLIQGENALFYQRQQSETRLSESDFCNLPRCGMEARTNLDSEMRRKGKDESHVNGDAAKTTSIEERHESQHVQMESENSMNGDGFDWEDGNIASCEGTMPAHTGRWNGDLTIEVEDDDSSKQAKKRPIRRATARDKEFAELVHKVHLLCLIGRGMLVNSACYDPLIQASLYSIVPPHFLNFANDRKLTANMLNPLVKWFQSTFHVRSSEESSSTQPEESKTFVTKLLHSIESRTGTIEEVAALSVALLRVLGLSTRYVSILDVAPLKPDTESLDASANWNSDTDTESGWSIPHMNTTKTTTASLGQILARCPSQLSPRDIVTEDHGGTESHGARGFGSTRGGDSGNCLPQEKSLETSYTEVESADAASKHTGTGYGNSEVTYSEGQEKGTIKRKGDLEFELELAMALSATAVEAQSNVNNENNIACKERHDTTRIDMLTSTSVRRHDIKKSRLGARQKNTAVWSRKLVPYLYWAEVYCEGETLTGRWVHVDAANGVVDGEHKVEEAAAACKRPLRYVLAFAGNGAKDVTRRYASKWSAIAPQRVSSQWWEVTMSPLKELEAAASAEASDMKASQEKKVQPSTLSPGINHQGCSNEVGSEDLVKLEASQICDKSTENDGKRFPEDANCISLETQDYKTPLADRSSLEDMELDTRTFTEPLPTNQQAYRSHHLYVLERWLTKYQTLYPKGPVLGFCAGQPVYPRTCVQSLHTAERWLREGLQIKKGETPVKVVKPSRNLAKECSSSPALLEEDCLEGRSTALFGKWQTETLQLPSAVGGIVPKNERGHVDVWSEKCLPPGTVHLRMQRLVPVAKRLGIDFAQAMVGFEIRNGRSVPIFEGIVICEEFRDAILQAYSEEEERREIEEEKRNERQALSRWNQLLRSIATRIRLQNAYEETYSNTVLSELRAVENIESVAKTSTSASDNAFEERNDARQVNIEEGNTHSLEQQNNDFTNTYETVTDVKSLSTQNHTHTFPTENQSYDEESAVWTKCCPCGFSIQVEEM